MCFRAGPLCARTQQTQCTKLTQWPRAREQTWRPPKATYIQLINYKVTVQAYTIVELKSVVIV